MHKKICFGKLYIHPQKKLNINKLVFFSVFKKKGTGILQSFTPNEAV